jgi:NADPH-dependent curcumin reductase CurA
MPEQNENRRIVLAARPQGAPNPEKDFRLERVERPEPADGQVLLRTLYLSIDPYMRGRMSEGPSYASPVALGDVMIGSTVSKVEKSRHPQYKEGDVVLADCGWQDFALSNGTELVRLDPNAGPLSAALGVLGMPGFTAYMGLLDIGQPKPGETLVVAAATGPVGATVGQIGKLKGCKVVGIAGGAEKCRYAREELGLDECLDHKEADLKTRLAKACDKGIDIYFENVGGEIFEAVLPLLTTKARIPVCGLISQYNATELPPGPDRSALIMRQVLTKRLKIQGFIIFDDYGSRYPEFRKEMSKWVQEGKVKYREDMVEGLEAAPQALVDVLSGRNFGKMVVQLTSNS